MAARHSKSRHSDKWGEGPIIYKVPLSPEQAVLSCCSLNFKPGRAWCYTNPSLNFCVYHHPTESNPIGPGWCPSPGQWGGAWGKAGTASQCFWISDISGRAGGPSAPS